MDVGPLPITKPESGSGFAPAMGIDGVVCKFGSNSYEFDSESEVVWPSDDVEGRREWSRWCWYKDLNCGVLPLRCEEECGGSIFSSW